MPRLIHRTLRGLIVIAALARVVTLHAQVRDTVAVRSSHDGPHLCCFDLTVSNRHDTTVSISEFRARIVSGRGRFVDGSTLAPQDWAIFQLASSVTWTSNTAAADIHGGTSRNGFHICARDTGIIRVVWETRNLEGILASDTLVLACGNDRCDEAFFRQQPSGNSCTYDVDLLAGNLAENVVNDFHLRLLTPGASFSTAPSRLPAGWTRSQVGADLINFQTTTSGLQLGRFAEGFRVIFASIPDSARVAWWSTSNGAVLCADTLILRCVPLSRGDTVRITASDPLPGCCQDFRLLNTHLPASDVDAFVLQITSPGAKIVADSFPPPGWKKRQLNAAHDSLAYAGILQPGDSIQFRSICFDNTAGVSDSVRYRWQSYVKGVLVSSGTGSIFCPRPLTSCDSLALVSVSGTAERCVALRLANRNSRAWSIDRLAIAIGNDGTRRRVLSAQAPANWHVERLTADSVIYAGGPLLAGAAALPFTLCVSLGDASTRDPLAITWSTSGPLGSLCGDVTRVNVTDTSGCDSVRFGGSSLTNGERCCFEVGFANRNGRRLLLDSFALEVVDPSVPIVSIRSPQIWHVVEDPAGHTIAFHGVAIARGDSTPRFAICLDSRAVSSSVVVPIVWRTYSGGELVCTDTLRFTCMGEGSAPCDTVPLLGSAPESGAGSCTYTFRLVNRHSPSGPINALSFRIVAGRGGFIGAHTSGAASSWTLASLTRSGVTFRGAGVATHDSIQFFSVTVDSSDGGPIVVEKCSVSDASPICCEQETLTCATGGVDPTPAPIELNLSRNVPNPFGGVTTIGYDLDASASVTVLVHDITGREVWRSARGREEAGHHEVRLDLRSLGAGFYFYTLDVGGRMVRFPERMVLVK
jgi:hypothetical protein